MKVFGLIGILLALSSCASQYVLPAGAKTAQVTYSVDHEVKAGLLKVGTAVYIFESENCGKAFIAGLLDSTQEDHKRFTLTVEANKLLVNTFSTPNGRGGFTYVTTTFAPKEGKSYKVIVSPRSAVSIYQETVDGWVPENTVVKPKKVCQF